MIKQIAWNTFKSTGNIDTLLELLKVDETINEVNRRDGLNQINSEVIIEKLNTNNETNNNIKLWIKQKERAKNGTYKDKRTNTSPE